MNIMTLNVRTTTFLDWGRRSWRKRAPIVANLLNRYAPAVVGLQECKPEQLRYLLDHTDYAVADGTRVSRDGRRGEMCPILYDSRTTTMPLVGSFFALNTTGKLGERGWGAMWPRICTWARFDGFTIFNTHLDVGSPRARAESVKLIIARSEEIAPKPFPVVLMGDFNATPASYPVALAQERFAYWSGSAPTKHGFNGRAKGCIDFIFSDLPIVKSETVRYEEGGVWPSDHHAILCELEVSQ